MNLEKLRAVREAIAAEPAKFDMNNLGYSAFNSDYHTCDTAMCFAGWVVHLNPDEALKARGARVTVGADSLAASILNMNNTERRFMFDGAWAVNTTNPDFNLSQVPVCAALEYLDKVLDTNDVFQHVSFENHI